MLIRLGKQVSIHLTLFFFFTPSSLTMSETKIDLYDLLTDDELETVCRRLNPQHEKPSLPTDDDEAIAWIVDKHFEKKKSKIMSK